MDEVKTFPSMGSLLQRDWLQTWEKSSAGGNSARHRWNEESVAKMSTQCSKSIISKTTPSQSHLPPSLLRKQVQNIEATSHWCLYEKLRLSSAHAGLSYTPQSWDVPPVPTSFGAWALDKKASITL